MKISVNAHNKSCVPRTNSVAQLCLGVGFAFFYLACAVPVVFATEASQDKAQFEALFVTNYRRPADVKRTPPPDTRISVYRVNIAGFDEQPKAEVVEVVFDAYEYWRNTLSVDPTVENYRDADDFYNLSLGVGGLEYYPEYNIAVFGLRKERRSEVFFERSMCFIFADGRSEPFYMVDLNPERLYHPGFVTRGEELYISLLSPMAPCELLVFPSNNPSRVRATTDYVNFYAAPMLCTEGSSIFFNQTFPFLTNLSPSEEEKAQHAKIERVQLPLEPSIPFSPHRKTWMLVANKEDRLVLREIVPMEENSSIGPLTKEGFQAVVTIMKEQNADGVNPVIWEEEPYITPKKEPALKHEIASTPEYSLWRAESGTVYKMENGQRSTIALDLEQDERLFLVKNKAFIKKQSAHDFAELQICDTETLFNSSKSERKTSSVTLEIGNKDLREDINGLQLIMPIAPKKTDQ